MAVKVLPDPVGVDKMTSIIDYQDRTTCVIFGDGCGAGPATAGQAAAVASQVC